LILLDFLRLIRHERTYVRRGRREAETAKTLDEPPGYDVLATTKGVVQVAPKEVRLRDWSDVTWMLKNLLRKRHQVRPKVCDPVDFQLQVSLQLSLDFAAVQFEQRFGCFQLVLTGDSTAITEDQEKVWPARLLGKYCLSLYVSNPRSNSCCREGE